jgi:hypothetical protein
LPAAPGRLRARTRNKSRTHLDRAVALYDPHGLRLLGGRGQIRIIAATVAPGARELVTVLHDLVRAERTMEVETPDRLGLLVNVVRQVKSGWRY